MNKMMENKIINKAHEFFNNVGRYPNLIKINSNMEDLFKTFRNFNHNTTMPFGIGEIGGMAVMCIQEEQNLLPNMTVQYWSNSELLGDLFLGEGIPQPKEYMYMICTGSYDSETSVQVLNKWDGLGFLSNIDEELKPPIATEMEKMHQFLNMLNGQYFIEGIENIVYPIIKKLLTIEKTDKTYNFNVYDVLLFTNFYYPQIKKYIDDIASKTPEKTFDTVLETCLILCEYYEHFLNGKGFSEFLLTKNQK
jgi:hypothetical protein